MNFANFNFRPRRAPSSSLLSSAPQTSNHPDITPLRRSVAVPIPVGPNSSSRPPWPPIYPKKEPSSVSPESHDDTPNTLQRAHPPPPPPPPPPLRETSNKTERRPRPKRRLSTEARKRRNARNRRRERRRRQASSHTGISVDFAPSLQTTVRDLLAGDAEITLTVTGNAACFIHPDRGEVLRLPTYRNQPDAVEDVADKPAEGEVSGSSTDSDDKDESRGDGDAELNGGNSANSVTTSERGEDRKDSCENDYVVTNEDEIHPATTMPSRTDEAPVRMPVSTPVTKGHLRSRTASNAHSVAITPTTLPVAGTSPVFKFRKRRTPSQGSESTATADNSKGIDNASPKKLPRLRRDAESSHATPTDPVADKSLDEILLSRRGSPSDDDHGGPVAESPGRMPSKYSLRSSSTKVLRESLHKSHSKEDYEVHDENHADYDDDVEDEDNDNSNKDLVDVAPKRRRRTRRSLQAQMKAPRSRTRQVGYDVTGSPARNNGPGRRQAAQRALNALRKTQALGKAKQDALEALGLDHEKLLDPHLSHEVQKAEISGVSTRQMKLRSQSTHGDNRAKFENDIRRVRSVNAFKRPRDTTGRFLSSLNRTGDGEHSPVESSHPSPTVTNNEPAQPSVDFNTYDANRTVDDLEACHVLDIVEARTNRAFLSNQSPSAEQEIDPFVDARSTHDALAERTRDQPLKHSETFGTNGGLVEGNAQAVGLTRSPPPVKSSVGNENDVVIDPVMAYPSFSIPILKDRVREVCEAVRKKVQKSSSNPLSLSSADDDIGMQVPDPNPNEPEKVIEQKEVITSPSVPVFTEMAKPVVSALKSGLNSPELKSISPDQKEQAPSKRRERARGSSVSAALRIARNRGKLETSAPVEQDKKDANPEVPGSNDVVEKELEFDNSGMQLSKPGKPTQTESLHNYGQKNGKVQQDCQDFNANGAQGNGTHNDGDSEIITFVESSELPKKQKRGNSGSAPRSRRRRKKNQVKGDIPLSHSIEESNYNRSVGVEIVEDEEQQRPITTQKFEARTWRKVTEKEGKAQSCENSAVKEVQEDEVEIDVTRRIDVTPFKIEFKEATITFPSSTLNGVMEVADLTENGRLTLEKNGRLTDEDGSTDEAAQGSVDATMEDDLKAKAANECGTQTDKLIISVSGSNSKGSRELDEAAKGTQHGHIASPDGLSQARTDEKLNPDDPSTSVVDEMSSMQQKKLDITETGSNSTLNSSRLPGIDSETKRPSSGERAVLVGEKKSKIEFICLLYEEETKCDLERGRGYSGGGAVVSRKRKLSKNGKGCAELNSSNFLPDATVGELETGLYDNLPPLSLVFEAESDPNSSERPSADDTSIAAQTSFVGEENAQSTVATPVESTPETDRDYVAVEQAVPQLPHAECEPKDRCGTVRADPAATFSGSGDMNHSDFVSSMLDGTLAFSDILDILGTDK